MDQCSFVESLFDTRCGLYGKSPRTLQNQFSNEFVGLNDAPIPEDFHIHGHESHNPIDFDDINVLKTKHEDEDVKLNIPGARGKRKGKNK